MERRRKELLNGSEKGLPRGGRRSEKEKRQKPFSVLSVLERRVSQKSMTIYDIHISDYGLGSSYCVADDIDFDILLQC